MLERCSRSGQPSQPQHHSLGKKVAVSKVRSLADWGSLSARTGLKRAEGGGGASGFQMISASFVSSGEAGLISLTAPSEGSAPMKP